MNELKQEKPLKVASVNGIDVFLIKSDKFKTNSINVFFRDFLNRENATLNSLLPAVLRRGCKALPTSRDIALYLEELYGASFDCGVAKKGEIQVMQFYVEGVSDKYTGGKESVFENTFDFLLDIITDPVLDNGVFKNEYVEQEKKNLKELIESRINDKVQYAVERCFEEICAGEPFSIYEHGFVEDLDRIDPVKLFEYYTEFLSRLPVSVYIAGNVNGEKIKYAVEKLSRLHRGNVKDIAMGAINPDVSEVKKIEEKMNINQGKLSIGFKTGIAANDPGYYKLLVCNVVLGGGMHSKLFQNVREKASLAYYAFSRLEKFKGLMVISSGIEIKNRDKAEDIILKQLDEIKAGNISDYEYESTIKTIETGINSLKDSQIQMVDFYLSQDISKTSDDFNSLIEKVKKVTKSDIVEASKKLKLSTVYFLTVSRGRGC